jgi:hypothetical protein
MQPSKLEVCLVRGFTRIDHPIIQQGCSTLLRATARPLAIEIMVDAPASRSQFT